ncbi:uncharacterized protein [Asterias amurensis]|uniref:uncharacterized protein n=1 Tax=Asterias amurensis TaxID=7602 RepID=UPI003AB68AF5
MSKSTNVAIRRAVSLFGCTRLLLYILMVDLQCVAQAGKLFDTTTAAGPNKEPRVTGEETSDVSGVRLELNVSGRVLKICRHCKRDFFRPEVEDKRQSKCNRCRPCTECAYEEQVTAPCTPTQDTKCTPLCGDGFYFNRVTRSCQRDVVIKHELFVEESTDVTSLNSEMILSTDRITITEQLSGHLKTFGRVNQRRQGSSSRVVDAESEEWSPAYVTSLFAIGAAGIALLVLLVVISIHVALRVKQWWNSETALEDRGPCHCTLLSCCIKPGNSSSTSNIMQANYSTNENRNFTTRHQQGRRPLVGIIVTRIKATAESNRTTGIDSNECQDGIVVDELQKNRVTRTLLSQLDENGIENTAGKSCDAASSDQFENPPFIGVETVI